MASSVSSLEAEASKGAVPRPMIPPRAALRPRGRPDGHHRQSHLGIGGPDVNLSLATDVH